MLTPEQKIAEHPLLLQRIAALEAQVSWFKKQVFGGGKSEKLDPAQRQLALDVEEARAAVVERTEKIAYERTKARPPGRPPRRRLAICRSRKRSRSFRSRCGGIPISTSGSARSAPLKWIWFPLVW